MNESTIWTCCGLHYTNAFRECRICGSPKVDNHPKRNSSAVKKCDKVNFVSPVKEFHFTCEMVIPTVTAQQRRYGKHGVYKTDEIKKAESTFRIAFKKHSPEYPFNSPLCVEIVLVYPFTQSRAKKQMAVTPKATRPDLDNTTKIIFDQLTKANFWLDDSLVYDYHVTKFYGDTPGISVSIFIDSEHLGRFKNKIT